jgi:hypothetical protein
MKRLLFPLSIGLLALVVLAALLLGGPYTRIDPPVLALFDSAELVPAACSPISATSSPCSRRR